MGYRVAVVGATGNVGREMLNILAERRFPASEVIALASSRSQGQEISYGDKRLKVQNLENFDFTGVDFALMSAGSAIAREYGEKIGATGCIVVDNSSFWRYHADVPLVVPEVNADAVTGFRKKNIIANPNCSTAQLVVALKPLHDVATIKRVVVSTYQSVSGAGKEGMDELFTQTRAVFVNDPIVSEKFSKRIAFNLIPQIDKFVEKDYTKEEMKMVNETHKMLHDDSIAITATTVRVPVFRSHAESVYVETADELTVDAVRKAIDAFPGAQVQDNPAEMEYPMPLFTSEKYDCYVGRIRKDLYNPKAINLWVSGDQIRKGAALNALQIAEYMLAHDMIH